MGTHTAYFVVRMHSNTDRQTLLKVGSRPLGDGIKAEHWAEFMNETEPHKNAWFVIQGPANLHKKNTSR